MQKEVKPLKDLLDSVRNIEGFPIGKDEDILALSNPPYYTACPNPYLNDFIAENGKPYDEATDTYQREPFVGDISEGKNDPIYNAHSYHTKVPHKAIMKYIEHYTEPGDIVFDGFCGTGMTGVAAQMLNRKAILSDLSPIATFIAHNYNSKVDVTAFEAEARQILAEVEAECGWMYETLHTDGGTKGKINYTVWSDVFICPFCGAEIVFFEAAYNESEGNILDKFSCHVCKAILKKDNCKRALETHNDLLIGKEVEQGKRICVLVNYKIGKKTYTKKPDKQDFDIIDRVCNSELPYWVPIDKMMFKDGAWGAIWRAGYHHGITHAHHFYTKRNLWILGALWSKTNNLNIKWAITSILNYVNMKQSYTGGGGGMPGVLYIASLVQEKNVFDVLLRKIKKLIKYFPKEIKTTNTIISNQSITDIKNLGVNSVDYIFTDPPFGSNIMYSEGSFLWESWLRIFTNNADEAIINNVQNKDLHSYYSLMIKSFSEYFRVLKPNRWITVEFHNSESSIWNAIQDALIKAGFVVANVAILDKMQGSFKQVTSAGAVKNDLVISAYKPKNSFQTKFLESAGEGMEEEFIRMHLSHLSPEPSIERTEQMLYSKLLAFYVRHSYTVKYDASTFYKMLRQEFAEADGFWFLPEQLPAYREYKQKMKLEGIAEIAAGQFTLFVADEKSALIWLNAFLTEPKDFQTIHPAFTKVAAVSGDAMPDLKELLQDNFVCEDGQYRRPQSEDEKQSITAKREKILLREFEELLLEAKATKHKIKECRKQVVLYGFEYCYKQERFADILALAQKLNKSILENDAELNDFVEVAQIKVEGV